MEVIAVDVPELGNRSYIIHDGKAGIVIDPSRRTRELVDIAKKHGITIRAVFETHIHNDYVTGGFSLAKELAADYYISAHEKVGFKCHKIDHEEVVNIGQLKITALASPGHTHHHLSYLVDSSDSTPSLFSGGSLLYGAVGRTDLVSAESTEKLAKDQYQTAHFFANRLKPETELYPTHGFGSFCAATETEHVSISTLRQQIMTNSVYTSKSESEFVKELIKNLDDFPAYYAYMAPINLKGPSDPKLNQPELLTKQAVMAALHSGAAIIDLRLRKAYAREHLKGTYNIELNNDFATYAGWLFAWDTPVILVARTAKEVHIAQERLSLIGREIIVGKISPTELLLSNSKIASYEISTFAKLADKIKTGKKVTVVDVRRKSEWLKGHLPNAKHIPLHQLQSRLSEIDNHQEILVHCASGFRASIAASMLSTSGTNVTLIDDDYDNAQKAGLIPIKKQKFVKDISLGKAQLLDVREKSEWDEEHAKNAIHIPLAKLLNGQINKLKKDLPIYVYCASGKRSGFAQSFLNGNGYKAINIGGLNDWRQSGGLV